MTSSDGSGFSVFYPGLIRTANCFGQEASTYESLMPDGGWSCPRGGNNAIDRMMNLTLIALGNAHKITADVIDTHAWKLMEAHETYKKSESNVIAGILNLAYEGGYPLDSIKAQPPNTVLPLGNKHFTPSPVSTAGLTELYPTPWQSLKYWDYSTLGLGVTGPPQADPYIGGDFKGMSEVAEKLHVFSYQAGRISGTAWPSGSVVDNLTAAVHKLLKESGEWNGPAARNFATAYSKDAANVHLLSDAAEKSAQAINDLVNKLFVLETDLEAAIEPLYERGYRVYCVGDEVSAAGAPGQPGYVTDSYTEKLTKLYRHHKKQADDERNAAAHALSQEYQKAVGVLQFYSDDTKFRAGSANINLSQYNVLQGDLQNFANLQKSYQKTEKGLGLNWGAGSESAIQAAIAAGGESTWAKVAGPVASIIFALIT